MASTEARAILIGIEGLGGLLSKLLTVAKAAVVPQLDFSIRSRSLATGACAHSVDIDSARVSRPNGGFVVKLRRSDGVMLLDAQIPNGMAGSGECAQELGTVVQESLSPLRMTGTDGEDAALECQGSAVGREALSSNRWPVLPKSG